MKISQPQAMQVRNVGEEVYKEQAVRVISGSCRFTTDIEDLWAAITDPKRLVRWFLPLSGELRVGGRYRLKGNAEGMILACNPPTTLDLTWEFAGNISWVQIRLHKEKAAAGLELRHLIPKDEASEKHWKQFGPGATGIGWDLGYFALALYLKSQDGELDQKNVETWLITEPGKTFVSECAMAWFHAHTNAGASQDDALKMAQQCIQFYTGD